VRRVEHLLQRRAEKLTTSITVSSTCIIFLYGISFSSVGKRKVSNNNANSHYKANL
jgi:hypothetical protein